MRKNSYFSDNLHLSTIGENIVILSFLIYKGTNPMQMFWTDALDKILYNW